MFVKLFLEYLQDINDYIPCSFLLWNLGEPKKLFLMLFNRLLQ